MKKLKFKQDAFIDPDLEKLTREFTKNEISEWEREDRLVAPKKIVTPKMFFEEN